MPAHSEAELMHAGHFLSEFLEEERKLTETFPDDCTWRHPKLELSDDRQKFAMELEPKEAQELIEWMYKKYAARIKLQKKLLKECLEEEKE